MSFTYAKYNLPTPSAGDLRVRGALWVSQLSKFVAVGGRSAGTKTDCVVTSPDGVTWTMHSGSEGNNWSGLAYSPTLGSGSGRLVAVAANGTHRVMYSDNGGSTWTNATASSANAWGSVVWASSLNLFVAVGLGVAIGSVMTSSDGITWSGQTAATTDGWSYLVWADSRFIAGAMTNTAETTGYMTSVNGSAWSSLTTPSVKPGLNSNVHNSNMGNLTLCFSSDLNMWVALVLDNLNATHEIYSTDHGSTWTEIAPFSHSIQDVCWAHELNLFIGTSGYPGIQTSPDGLTWTFEDLSSFDVNDFWVKVVYSPDLESFVAFNEGNFNTVLLGSGANPLSPTDGPAVGGTTLTIQGDGATNGGFTRTGADVQVSVGVDLQAKFSVDLTTWQTAEIPDILFTPYGQCSSVVVTDAANLTAVTTHGKSAGNDVLVWDNNNSLGGANVLFWSPAVYTYDGPLVTSASPTHGIQGATVTLTGTNLFRGDEPIFGINDPGTVTFDGVAATNVTYVNTTTLTCTAPAHVSGHTGIIDIVYSPPHLTVTFGLGGYFTYPDSTLSAYFTYDTTWLSLPGGVYVDSAITGEGALVSGEADLGATGIIVLTSDGGIKFGGSTEMDILVASVPVAQRGGQWELNAFNFKGRLEEVG